MNNFHIYEEVGRGKFSVVYKVSTLLIILIKMFLFPLLGSKEEIHRLRSC
jgi:hypothetical protein